MDHIEEIADTAVGWLDWLPPWAASLIVLGGTAFIAVFVHKAVFRALSRLVEGSTLFWRSTVQRIYGPARLAVLCLALAIGASISPLSYAQAALIRMGLVVAFIIVLGWSAMTVMHIGVTVYTRRFTQAAADSVAARKVMTQIRILERAGGLLIVIVTAAAALMTFPDVRQYGVSLLASAGAAGTSSVWLCSRCWPICSPASNSPSPSRSASRIRSWSKANGAGSRRSPRPMSLSASGIGAGWCCR